MSNNKMIIIKAYATYCFIPRRLLHAALEQQEQTEDDTQEQELTNSLAELYQNNKDGPSSGSKGKKR